MSNPQSHVMLVPYPSQGHINPMLQFAKCLSSYGVIATIAITKSILNSARSELDFVRLGSISDGFDQGGFEECGSLETYLDRLKSVGSQTLEELILFEREANRPVRIIIYDSFLSWVVDVGRRLNLPTSTFFTQFCAVNTIYYHMRENNIKMPIHEALELPGLPRLEIKDLPSYFSNATQYPAYLAMLLNQFNNLDRADEVLVNSIYELEPQELDYLSSKYRLKSIGPTVPSRYVDNRIPTDTHYGFNLFALTNEPCMQWLDSKPASSVIYVSFGSMVSLAAEQMKEISFGLADSGFDFLWVVRSSEASKVPENLIELHCKGRGIIVSWTSQIQVLAHKAVGCFLTHCGWNSTIEGLCLGVPMIGMPQWTDQPLNAKYIKDVWKVGVRVSEDESGLVRREEVVRCVKEVMNGEKGEEIRRNASNWKEKARKAMEEGGSSDTNIVEFIAKYCS